MKLPDVSQTIAGGAATELITRPEDEARLARWQELLDAERDAGMIGAFAVARHGDRITRLVSGVADVATGRSPRPWLRQRAGGVIKSFVGAVVLQLAGERELDLDAPIRRYLADLVTGERGRQITVRMLLNHTSGIADHMKILYATPERIIETGERSYAPGELVRMGLELGPAGTVGSTWSYANTNYVILGLLIQRITGQPYGVELTRRIIRPLDLRDTYLPGTDPQIRGPHQHAYLRLSDGSLHDCTDYNVSWVWAAGELISSGQDLNTFYRALLGGRLLEPGLLREMKDTVPFNPAATGAGGYGLGLMWLGSAAGPLWGHNGLAAGQTTYCSNSEDAATQLTIGENFNFYETFGSTSHPIDAARRAFIAAIFADRQG